MGDVQGENENEDVAGQVRKLNHLHEQNRQEIVVLWRKVRELHRGEMKLAGEKGLVGYEARRDRWYGVRPCVDGVFGNGVGFVAI